MEKPSRQVCREGVLPHSVWRIYPVIWPIKRGSREFQEAPVARQRSDGPSRRPNTWRSGCVWHTGSSGHLPRLRAVFEAASRVAATSASGFSCTW